jgi:hypothetical protein
MPKTMTMVEKRGRTQWAAQFLAAAELVRRGYTVAFTMGNYTPDADLAVIAPKTRQHFLVDVKGLASKSAWLINPKTRRSDLYYILTHVASERQDDRFFILTNSEARQVTAWYKPNPKKKWKTPGFNFSAGEPFEDKWDKLPR